MKSIKNSILIYRLKHNKPKPKITQTSTSIHTPDYAFPQQTKTHPTDVHGGRWVHPLRRLIHKRWAVDLPRCISTHEEKMSKLKRKGLSEVM